MAFEARDGRQFSMSSRMRAHDRGMSDPQEKTQVLDQPDQGSEDQDQAPQIENDPEAMQCVDILKQKGYTADDVERAMGGGDDQQMQPQDDQQGY